MTKHIQINEKEYCTVVQVKKPFQSVKLTTAKEVLGEAFENSVPHVELTLLGPKMKFCFHSNRISNSTNFNCFDLLTTAKETIKESEVAFTELQISCNKNLYQGKFEIHLRVDYN